MLGDRIIALLIAWSEEEKELAYCNLERIGVDRATADMIAGEYYQPGVKANG